MPDDTDRFIEALGLGRQRVPLPELPTKRSSLQWCSETNEPKYICTGPEYEGEIENL